MRLVSKEEVVSKLIEAIKIFKEKELNKNEKKEEVKIITRIKNSTTMLKMYGTVPYITFLVSKYNRDEYDKEGYVGFLNFLLYILKELKIISNGIPISAENLKDPKTAINAVIEFLKWFKKEVIDNKKEKIFRRNLEIILEEMKKIYTGLFKEKE